MDSIFIKISNGNLFKFVNVTYYTFADFIKTVDVYLNAGYKIEVKRIRL